MTALAASHTLWKNVSRISVAGVAWLFATGCDSAADRAKDTSLTIPRFEVSEVPTFSITDGDDPDHQFTNAAARRLTTGEIVVADQGAITLRVFGRDGSLLRTLATRGSGPGEINGPFVLVHAGDSIMAVGQAPMSKSGVQLYSHSTFVRWLRPSDSTAPSLQPLGRLSSGPWFVERGRGFRVLAEGPTLGMLRPDSTGVGLWHEPNDKHGSRFIPLPAGVRQWFYAYPWINGPIPAAAAPYPFAAHTLFAVSGERLWRVDGERATVEAFDANGNVTGRAELPTTTEPFDERAWGARRARDLAAITRPRDSAKVIAMYDPSIRPARAPAFVRALGATNGELWLERFKLDDTTPREFVVVSDSARIVGAVTIPRWLDLQQVGADFVLGIRRTVDGIESIVELPLKRGRAR